MKTLFITAILLSSIFISCKSSSQPMGADRITPANSGKEKVVKEQAEGVYDIIVSFASRGAGINRDARKKLDTEIESFNQKNSVTVNLEKYGWGREGEVDYLILTKNLSTKQKKALIAQIKAAVGTADQVLISYDQKSVHKR